MSVTAEVVADQKVQASCSPNLKKEKEALFFTRTNLIPRGLVSSERRFIEVTNLRKKHS